jgi:mannosyl-oligosaccharide alpha-1,2-mannosidase
MAELGSLSVEFTRLAQLTQENKYYDAVARITDALETMQNGTKFPGMWPLLLDASGCKKPAAIVRDDLPSAKELETGGAQNASTPATKQPASADPQSGNLSKRDGGLDVDAQPADYVKAAKSEPVSDSSQSKCEKQGLATPPHSTSDTFGLGGQSDSTYEYLPKEYMLLGGLNDQYRGLYETAMDTVRKTLLFRPMLQEKQRDIRFTATVAVSQPEDGEGDNQIKYTYEGTHLTCFAGGMFAVGAKLFGLDGDMDIAAKLTDGCVWAYESTTTGIMPEKFEVLPCEDVNLCAWNETRYHDALDPFEGARIQQAEQRYDRQVRIAKQAHETTASSIPEKPKAPKTPPLALPVIKSDSERITGNGKSSERDALPSAENETGYIDLAKRDAHDDEEFEAYIARGPTKTAPQGAGPGSNTREEVPLVLPPKPSVLSHKEFVEARIKEERMPIGMTNIKSRSYILRPEAIESVFIMFRITGDEAWREKGWTMFEAISRYCRTDLADSAIKDVTSEAPLFTNVMESFWLAETLKYFYLLFSDPSLVSLDEYVL